MGIDPQPCVAFNTFGSYCLAAPAGYVYCGLAITPHLMTGQTVSLEHLHNYAVQFCVQRRGFTHDTFREPEVCHGFWHHLLITGATETSCGILLITFSICNVSSLTSGSGSCLWKRSPAPPIFFFTKHIQTFLLTWAWLVLGTNAQSEFAHGRNRSRSHECQNWANVTAHSYNQEAYRRMVREHKCSRA